MAIMLEIEGVFNVIGRGKFVAVRQIDPMANFYITEKSFLGNVELAKYLDIPRALNEYGQQREDIVVLQLKNPDDAHKLIPNTIVEIIPGNEIHLLEPWYKLNDGSDMLATQLSREISRKHVLYGKQVKAIAHRKGNDDILFEITSGKQQYAVVHLTWKQGVEKNPIFPSTRLYKDWLDLYNNCIVVDHNEFDQ